MLTQAIINFDYLAKDISIELAELGFNEPCKLAYYGESIYTMKFKNKNSDIGFAVTLPTIDDALNFFENKYNIYIELTLIKTDFPIKYKYDMYRILDNKLVKIKVGTDSYSSRQEVKYFSILDIIEYLKDKPA